MASVPGPARADEATPLVSGRRTNRHDGVWGAMRNAKYGVLTVCLGSLIAVASTSRAAPGSMLGFPSIDFSGTSGSIIDQRYAADAAPAPYTSKSGAPRVGEAPAPVPEKSEATATSAAADIERALHEAEGEIDRSKEYASIQADNAEQLDTDFHKSQEQFQKFKEITDEQLSTLRQQVADLSKANDDLLTENAEVTEEMKWHKSIALQEREKFLKIGFQLSGKAHEGLDEEDVVSSLQRDLKVMYYELRKTQQKKYENYLKFQKANKVNAKLNVEVASVTSTYEKLVKDSEAAADTAHTQHEAHIALTLNLHDEIERLESKLAGVEATHTSETKKVTEKLAACSEKTSEQAGNLKYLDQQVQGLEAKVDTCDKELNFTKTQSYTVTSDLTKQLKATQSEKETLFTQSKAQAEKIADLNAEKVDLLTHVADGTEEITQCKNALHLSQNATATCVGDYKTTDKKLNDAAIEIGNLKGRHRTTMAAITKNTHAMEAAIDTCQQEHQQCVGKNKQHAELLESCAERKNDLESQIVLERNAHAKITGGLETTLSHCRNSTELLEGKLEAHGDLLDDANKRKAQLEDQVDMWQEKYDTDTKALDESLKSEQAAKAKCVGEYAESKTIITDCKKNVDELETTAEKTNAMIEEKSAECESTIKTCQDEKQKCVGESAASTELLADIKENVGALEGKLQAAEVEFNKTNTAFTAAIDSCQNDKQKCIGESKAAKDLITECVDTRADLQTQLVLKTALNAKLVNETDAAIKTLQDEKQACIGKNKASLELIADAKATAADFEEQLGKSTAALAETTARCDADVKQLQEEKQTCVGQNKASQTVIADCKSATADLEGKLNTTTATLISTTEQCGTDVKQLQEEKQTCVGQNKASLELVKDCKSAAADFEEQLGKTTATLAETTASTDAAIKQLQEEKQTCVGQNKASLELIADCKATAADFEDKLNKTSTTLAEATAQCDTDVKQLQEEKQTCVGQNKASLELIVDCKATAADFEKQLNETTATLAETTVSTDAAIKQLQEEKQEAVGRAAANDEVVKDLKENLQVIEKKMDESEDESEEEMAAMVTKLKELSAAKEECLVKNGAHKTVIGDLESNVDRLESNLNKTRTTLAGTTAASAAKVKELSAAKEECLVKNGAHAVVIGDLEKNVGRLESSLATTRTTLAETTSEAAAKVKELSAAKEACLVKDGAHATVIEDLESNVGRLESNLNKTRTTLAETSATSAAKVKELTAAKEQCLVKNGAHKTIIDDLESNVGKCQTALNTTRTTLVKTMTESAAKVNSLTAEKEQLLVRNGAHATIIDDLNANVDKCESNLNKTSTTLAEANAASAAKVKELTTAKEECLTKNGASKTIIDDLESNVNTCKTRLNGAVAELAETSKNMTTQLTTARAAIKTCVSESGAQSTVIADLKQNVGRCEDVLSDTKQAANASNTEFTKRIKEITASKEECLVKGGASKTMIDDLSENVGRCEKNLNSTAAELKSVKTTSALKIKELEKNKEFLLTQGGAFQTIIDDLETEVTAAEKKISLTKIQLANITTTLNAQVKECTAAKAEVMVSNGGQVKKIANLQEAWATCGEELNATRAEFNTVTVKAAEQIKTCDAARDKCVVANGAHEQVKKDLEGDVERLRQAVATVEADLEDREDKLNNQVERGLAKQEACLAKLKANDEFVQEKERETNAQIELTSKCVKREKSLGDQLDKANELKELCTETHAHLDTKFASLNDDVTRLSAAAEKEAAAHAKTKTFYEKQSGEIKVELAKTVAAKNAAEATSGKCAASVADLKDDVTSCEEQIAINKEQVAKDKAYLVQRSNDLDSLVSGLRANNSECLVMYSRMENVASATGTTVTKCYAELAATKSKVTEATYYAEKMEEELQEIVEELGECQNTDLPAVEASSAPAPPSPGSPPAGAPSVTLVQGGVTTVAVKSAAEIECDAVKANLTALMSENWCRPPLRTVTLNPPDTKRQKSCVYGNSAAGIGHDQGMLNSDLAWIACKNDASQWYTMDAGEVRTIMGISTQARRSSGQRVTKYKVAYANTPEGPWTYVNNGTEFDGNRYDSTEHPEENVFDTPVQAQFMKIEPTAWNQHISMRAGLIYSPKIGESFTLNPVEKDRDYSSVAGNQAPGVGHARSMLDSDQAWSAAHNRAGEHMTIDGEKVQTVSGVVMQSRRNSDQMVRVFKVLVSEEGEADEDFEYVDGGRFFVGNTVRNQVETVMFADPVQARYVRIEVHMWNQHISMRAGLMVIEGPPPPPSERWIPDPSTIVSMNPPDDARTMTTAYGNDKPGYRYNTGMLDSNEGWLSSRNDVYQFYIMDAGEVMAIAGVVTQNRKRQNQYVNIYKVSVSNDIHGPYAEVDNGAAFVGNTKNSDDKVEAMFLEPVEARYVKIEPLVWVGHMAMRAGLKVVEDSTVEDFPALPDTLVLNPPDSARTASSSLHNHKSGTGYFTSMLDSRGGWLTGQNVAGQYLTIDAGEIRPISGVVLQNRMNTDHFVATFKVLTSDNEDGPFMYVADGAEFVGNMLPLSSAQKAHARFPEAVAARFVRIEVVTWNGHIAMRAGLEYVRKPPPPYPCSKDGGDCPCPGGEVYYGKAPATTSPSDKVSFEEMLEATHAKFKGGKNVKCAVETFGADPLPDKIKSCYCVPPLPALPVEVNPPDNARYMSSSYANDKPGYRYNTGMLDGQYGWLAGRNAAGETYTMDAGAAMDIAGVVTQGRTNSAEQTTEFKVLVSNEERGPFKYVDGGEVFLNSAGYDVHTQTLFAEVVSARYVQIEAVKWHGRVAMRAGILAMAGTEQAVSAEDGKTLAIANVAEVARDYSTVYGNQAKGTGYARSMLDSEQAWSAQHNRAGEWMTIDAGKMATVEGVVVQSRRGSDQMVNTFKVSTSDELHGEYTYVADGGIFSGNTYRDEQVMVKFPEPVVARFVRIEVVSWNQHISMRAGLMYKPKDGETYMINPDEGSRHYSSVHGNQAPGTGHARSALNSEQGWSAARNAAGEWMTMDSGTVQTIAGVTMQSRRNNDQMVRAFKVLVSNQPDSNFTYVDEGRMFVGNTIRNSVEKVKFADPVQARYVRIEVHMWNQHISMRAGLMVIEGPPPPPSERWIPDPSTIVSMNPPDDARTMTTAYGNDKPGYRYNTGMLDSNEGWLSSRNDVYQFYIMDAGEVMAIAGVVTQNRKRQNQYVNIYKVSVSNDIHGPYAEVDNGAAFVGNTKNSDDKVEAMFLEPVEARYVKIEPLVWVGHMAMRAGLKVVEDSTVEDFPALPDTLVLNPPDSARTASSSLHNHKSGTGYFTSMLDSRGGWLTGQNVAGQYLTIDAGEIRPISGVVLQNRMNTDHFVATFKVLTSDNEDGPFMYVADGAEFVGNMLPLSSAQKAHARFPEAVAARFVRIEVVTWNGHIAMRAGLEYVRKPPPPYPCSKDGGDCPCPGGEVYYGKAPATTSPSDKVSFEEMLEATHAKFKGGKNVKCAVETFGADPLPDKIKSCYCVPPLPALPVEVNPPDNARYMSSSYANDKPGYRYNTGMLDGQYGWLAGRNAAGETYTMDAGAAMDIAGVVTQGRTNSAEQTTEFKVLVSNEERGPFKYVDGGEVFLNSAGYDVHTQTLFAEVVSARYVQIEAVKWHGRVAMRAGILAMAGTEQAVSAEDGKTLAIANVAEVARDYSTVYGNQAKGTGYARSMLDSEQAWSAQHNRAGEWMTIDAGKMATVEGVVVQSRRGSDQMVNTFKVSTSDELHGEYTYVADGGIFSGNTYRDEQVMVKFPEPVVARFVRIEVVSWNQHISMRAGLMYKPKDGETYMINPDEGSRHYSSVHGNQAPGTGHARSALNSEQGWSAARNAAGEWMTMDSGTVQTIAGVTMQSRRNNDQMVRAFKVLVSNQPDSNFTYVDEGRMFVGNTIRNSVEKVKFADPVSARYVRIEVHMWNQHITMRAGLLVMQGPCPEPKKRVTADPSTLVLMNPPDDARYTSTSYGNDKSGYRYNTGMLDSNEGWLSSRNDVYQFYIMDAGDVMSIAGVVTQNRKRHSQYVSFYKVSVSNSLTGPYEEVDNGATFVGNTKNSDDKAEAMFLEPVVARYVKIEPKVWVGHMAMRAGFKVVKDSTVEVPALPELTGLNPDENHRLYSSVHGNSRSGTGYAQSMLDSPQGWSSAHNAAGQYLTMDAGEEPPAISGVVLQARKNSDQYVTTFKVLTSENANGPFVYVADGAVFTAPYAAPRSDEKVTVRFPESIETRFVRIEVLTWNAHMSMRAGLAIVAPEVLIACVDQATCESRAQKDGLAIGGGGYQFAGDYGTKGCYTYEAGTYAGMVFYGTGGDAEASADDVAAPKARMMCVATPEQKKAAEMAAWQKAGAPLGEGTFVLRGGNSGQLCADEGDKIVCNRNAVGPLEKFTLEKHGNYYALKGGKDGRYCADEGSRVTCNRPWVHSWERFTIEKHGDKISLKGGRGGKFCADEGHAGVKCDRHAVGSWESFSLQKA